MANINRVNAPFTSLTWYYTGGVLDTVVGRNPQQIPYLLGDNTQLLNSLDPVQTPTIHQLESDPFGAGVKANILLAFQIGTSITNLEIFGEIFIENQTASPNANLQYNEFFGITYSAEDRALSFINAFNNNTSLNWRYIAVQGIFPNQNQVLITALFEGSQYTFDPLHFTVTPAGTQLIQNPGVDANRGMRYQNYNYKCFVEIWEIDAEWLRVGSSADVPGFAVPDKRFITTLEQPWTPDNLFTFDVSKFLFLDKFISDYPSVPNTNFVAQTINPNVSLPNGKTPIQGYFLKWGESFQGGFDTGFRNITASINGFVITITATDAPVKIGSVVTGPGVVPGTIINQFIGGNDYQLDINNGIIASTAMTLQGETSPIETDPWNITNTNYTKTYLGQTEIRWASNGMYNLGILILFNEHPEHWLSVNQIRPSGPLTNEYQTILVAQSFIRYPKLRRRIYEPEYLSVYVNQDQQTTNTFQLRLRHDWTFVNGGTATSYSNLTTNLQGNDLYEVNASLDNIQFDAVETAAGFRVLHWNTTVEMARDNVNFTDLSKPVRYDMDLNCEDEKMYKKIWFIGSFGTVESFEFEGLQEVTLEYDADYYRKSFKNALYERNTHISSAITKVPTRRFKLNSGWLTADQYGWLEDLLKTNQVWWKSNYRLDFYLLGELVPADYNNFEAINIVDSSFAFSNDEKLFNLEIVIEYSIPENTIF
jgi:hypothetical protein